MKSTKDSIILNQVGFQANTRKLFYAPKSFENQFQIEKMQDCEFTPVFRSTLEESPDADTRVGDFTSVTEEGIYRIKMGSRNSRIFVIQNAMNDPIQRLLFNFVTWQSCGSPLGWNGACHLDESITLGTGEQRSLAGGFHQSSDLRKWSWGISLGMIGLIEYALKSKPAWDQGELAREIKHGADFYLRLILDDGSVLDSTFIPLDDENQLLERRDAQHLTIHGKGYDDYSIMWNSREFYERPTAPPGQWFTIRFLSLAARYFDGIDYDFSERCLSGAKRIWNYMDKNAKALYPYKVATLPPLGHEPLNKWWTPFYENSAMELAGKASAAIELALTSKSTSFDSVISECLNELCKLQISGSDDILNGSFWEGTSERLANNYHYFFTTTVPYAICLGIELLEMRQDVTTWRNSLKLICDQYVAVSKKNVFNRIQGNLFTNDIFEEGANFSFSEELAVEPKEKFPAGTFNGIPFSYRYFSFCYNLDLSVASVILKKAGKLFANQDYADVAQSQIDWLLGANPFDSSSVEGLGYNNPHRGVFGEFFPPVPQIPGGVYTGLTEHAFWEEAYGLECEYDLPETTWLLYLLAL